MRAGVSRRGLLAGLAGALGAVACDKNAGAQGLELTFGAAASLRRVMPAVVDAYRQAQPQIHVRVSYGASGDLRKRTMDGAPFDGVLLANAQPVDELIGSGYIDASTRKVVARNDLVLVAPKGSDSRLTFETIDRLPAGEKLAIGEPATVPAGQYAKQALERLDKWGAVQSQLVLGGDVAAVLAYVRRGEVAAAVVYGTEVIDIADVQLLDRAEGDWAPAPEVVAGVIAKAPYAAEARRFVDYLVSDAGQRIFEAHGFGRAP